jgi:hypothetical protein
VDRMDAGSIGVGAPCRAGDQRVGRAAAIKNSY